MYLNHLLFEVGAVRGQARSAWSKQLLLSKFEPSDAFRSIAPLAASRFDVGDAALTHGQYVANPYAGADSALVTVCGRSYG